MLYYSYRIRDWTYYYPNGQLEAKGKYKLENVAEGRINGQTIKKPVIDSTWMVFNETNERLKPEDQIKSELEEQ
jgi:hypothetical protein